MKQWKETEETTRLEFARKAAAYFAENPAAVTYTKSGLEPDCFVAFRWGLGGDCVVVFKTHEYEEIVNYVQFIPRDKAAKHEAFNNAGLMAIQ